MRACAGKNSSLHRLGRMCYDPRAKDFGKLSSIQMHWTFDETETCLDGCTECSRECHGSSKQNTSWYFPWIKNIIIVSVSGIRFLVINSNLKDAGFKVGVHYMESRVWIVPLQTLCKIDITKKYAYICVVNKNTRNYFHLTMLCTLYPASLHGYNILTNIQPYCIMVHFQKATALKTPGVWGCTRL